MPPGVTRVNITTRPFGAHVGPSSRNDSVSLFSSEPSVRVLRGISDALGYMPVYVRYNSGLPVARKRVAGRSRLARLFARVASRYAADPRFAGGRFCAVSFRTGPFGVRF